MICCIDIHCHGVGKGMAYRKACLDQTCTNLEAALTSQERSALQKHAAVRTRDDRRSRA